MSPGIVGCAEQFVDIALAISDVDDSPWVSEQRRRLPQVFQPAIALLLLDRYTSGIDAALERIRAMELVPGPELDGGQPERKAIPRHHKTGMHQNSACRMVTRLATKSIFRRHLVHDADRFGVLAMIGELSRVVKYQNRSVASGCESFPCAEKVACQNLLLTDSFVRQKTIGRLRTRPVLAGKGYAATNLIRELSQQSAEPLPVPRVVELAARNFALQPTANLFIRKVRPSLHPRSSTSLHPAYKCLT
jgi:hypothetical protein